MLGLFYFLDIHGKYINIISVHFMQGDLMVAPVSPLIQLKELYRASQEGLRERLAEEKARRQREDKLRSFTDEYNQRARALEEMRLNRKAKAHIAHILTNA